MENLSWPKWPEIDINSMRFTSSSLLNGRFSISGDDLNASSYIRIAELKMAAMTKMQYSILTANGSAALLLAMQGLNIGIGDEVILPAMTWVGVATAVLRVGAKPVFIDSFVENDSKKFQEIDDKVSSRTKAMIVPHFYATLMNIGLLKKRYPNILIIEDSSHCSCLFESFLRNEAQESDIIIYSLQATKSVTCGEGGVVLVNEKNLWERIVSLRNDSRTYHIAKSNRLELKEGKYHGANLNLSDIQAALLLDQLDKYSYQCLKRAKGFSQFKNICKGEELVDLEYSKELTQVGNYYGIPVRLNCSSNSFSKIRSQIEHSLNLKFWNVYTPIPFSKLYKPFSNKSYVADQKPKMEDFSNSFKWTQNRFIIPHHVFLSDERQIERLGEQILQKDKFTSIKKQRNNEKISIIILTQNRQESLQRAIASVIKQDCEGSLELIIVGDNCKYLENIHLPKNKRQIVLRKHNLMLDLGNPLNPTVHKVAILRNFAIRLASSDFICFLDDDNIWERNHLSSLMNTILKEKCMASYSWRKLYLKNGKPWVPKIWPWIGSDVPQKKLFQIYSKIGMIENYSNVLKDRTEAIFNGRNYATVDMGAWLFRKEIFNVVSFKTDYSKEEGDSLVTEDDQLLIDLNKYKFSLSSTKKATLHYFLGGFSNQYNQK